MAVPPAWRSRGDMGAENSCRDSLRARIVGSPARSARCTWATPPRDFAVAIAPVQDIDFTIETSGCTASRCTQLPDAYLAQRANFCAEFAIAQWLTRTVEVGDRDGATHAVSMLLDIQDDHRASGELLGQVGPLVGPTSSYWVATYRMVFGSAGFQFSPQYCTAGLNWAVYPLTRAR